MADPRLLSLKEWETFYVITGGAAAALTGLMFVVIALRTERATEGHEGAVRAFGTPTVLHFCGALLIAALVSIPSHTAASLALCVGTAGVAGLALSAWAAIQARRQSWYAPVLSDWIWHVAMPMVAYTAIAVAAVVLSRRLAAALDLVGGASLLLVFIGIRNAWDAAVWIAARGR